MKVTLPAAVVLVLSIWLLCTGCKNSTGPSDSSEPPGEYVYVQPPETGDGWETASLVDTGYFGRTAPDMEWLTQYVLPTFM